MMNENKFNLRMMKKITLLFTLLFLSVISFAQMRNVTFSVDMTGQTFTQPYVSGSLNSWSGDANPLADQGNGIWSVTLPLADGTYEYKFTYDNWAGQESFTQGDVCSITNGGGNHNRYLIVDGSDVTIATAPFGGCAESSSNPGPHNLTVTVDMSGYGGDLSAGVTINGENYNNQGFGNWCGACNPLTDQGNGIWGKTIPLEEFTYQFKITVGNWAAQEIFTAGDPGTVANDGNVNRFIQMNGDKTINLVWNQAAVLSTKDNVLFESSISSNPTDREWIIKTPSTKIKSVQVFNILGKQVYSAKLDRNEAVIPALGLNSGIYIARIQTELGVKSIKLLRK